MVNVPAAASTDLSFDRCATALLEEDSPSAVQFVLVNFFSGAALTQRSLECSPVPLLLPQATTGRFYSPSAPFPDGARRLRGGTAPCQVGACGDRGTGRERESALPSATRPAAAGPSPSSRGLSGATRRRGSVWNVGKLGGRWWARLPGVNVLRAPEPCASMAVTWRRTCCVFAASREKPGGRERNWPRRNERIYFVESCGLKSFGPNLSP